MRKNIVKRDWTITGKRCAASLLECGLIVTAVFLLHLPAPANYFQWVEKAIVVFVISFGIVACCSFLFFRQDTRITIKRFKNIFAKKGKRILGR